MCRTLTHTYTHIFLCGHVGTKEDDKKHKIWGVISSIKKAWNQSVLEMNRWEPLQCCHPLSNLYNCIINCAILSLSSVNFVLPRQADDMMTSGLRLSIFYPRPDLTSTLNIWQFLMSLESDRWENRAAKGGTLPKVTFPSKGLSSGDWGAWVLEPHVRMFSLRFPRGIEKQAGDRGRDVQRRVQWLELLMFPPCLPALELCDPDPWISSPVAVNLGWRGCRLLIRVLSVSTRSSVRCAAAPRCQLWPF